LNPLPAPKLRCRPVAGSYNDREMKATFTAVVKQRGEWWIGWIEEVPGVNAQERTKEELLKSLGEALGEALEFNREEARRAAEGDYVEEPVTV
jgi:predicted RNase H-like HicB family nuclease